MNRIISSQTRPANFLRLSDGEEQAPERDFFRAAARGLQSSPRSIPSRFFYDDRGSELFQEITRLPEYYPAACEREVLTRQSQAIADYWGDNFGLIELGPGDGHKSYHLLKSLQQRQASFRYYPVDISSGVMSPLQDNLADLDLDFHGIVGDYEAGLRYLQGREERHVVLFLGSSIGNFSVAESLDFLRMLRMTLNEGDLLLIGFDMVKDPSVLIPAYSDRQGVTAQFNLNLLHRMNRELGADIDVGQFFHHAAFNPRTHAMESYLIAHQPVEFCLKDPFSRVEVTVSMDAFDCIQTETSQKYTHSDLEFLCRGAGFRSLKTFTDAQNYFYDCLWIADAPQIP